MLPLCAVEEGCGQHAKYAHEGGKTINSKKCQKQTSFVAVEQGTLLTKELCPRRPLMRELPSPQSPECTMLHQNLSCSITSALSHVELIN